MTELLSPYQIEILADTFTRVAVKNERARILAIVTEMIEHQSEHTSHGIRIRAALKEFIRRARLE